MTYSNWADVQSISDTTNKMIERKENVIDLNILVRMLLLDRLTDPSFGSRNGKLVHQPLLTVWWFHVNFRPNRFTIFYSTCEKCGSTAAKSKLHFSIKIRLEKLGFEHLVYFLRCQTTNKFASIFIGLK